MKKIIIIFFILLTSLNTAADITSVDTKYSALCEAIGVPGFKWRDDKWEAKIFTNNLIVATKQEYEKTWDDPDFDDDKVVNRFCVGAQEGFTETSNGFIQDACYGFKEPGKEYFMTDFTNCRETWIEKDDGSIKLDVVNCIETGYEKIKYDFRVNGDFSAYKRELELGFSYDGKKDDIWMMLGTCNLL